MLETLIEKIINKNGQFLLLLDVNDAQNMKENKTVANSENFTFRPN